MKEKYMTPELELLCFASAQRLANTDGEIDFSDLTGSGGLTNGASSDINDVIVPVPVTPIS